MSDSSAEYLTFLLGGEEFGVDILRVQEIMGWSPVTEIPGTPGYLKGVINLRGLIVPIVDMRQRFGLETAQYSETTVVIVLRAGGTGDDSLAVGLVVDAVSEVYKVEHRDIKKAPDFGAAIDSRFIISMAAVDEKLIILLDTQKLLNVNDLYSVVSQAKPVAAQA
ncbi:chemotaxis protein CheW [Halioxenophilus aromaticivorans]|uniref:Chemotaxis protein CheW n=1 Tax=Halioxenophilus aromaticivorans TaxID=1306992 RepID=A0AAV3U2E7_9ALTE